MQRLITLTVSASLVVLGVAPHFDAASVPHGAGVSSPTGFTGTQSRTALLTSAKTLCLVTPIGTLQAEVVKKLAAWGRLTLVSDFSGADLVMDIERLDPLNAYSEFRDSQGGGTAFAATVRHRQSGVAVWSTSKGASWPLSDPTGAWAGRAIADEFADYFDKILRPAASSHVPQGTEVAAAIAAGQRGEGIKPILLGYGGADDPYQIALAYPPDVRIALAARAATQRGDAFTEKEVRPSLIEPVVYIAVESREKMAAVSRSEPKAKPERILILPKPTSPMDDGVDADVVGDFSSLLPSIGQAFDGRVFSVPAADWKARGYVVIFEEAALSTGGESGRERRCWVYGPAK